MPLPSLQGTLAEANSLVDLARRVGAVCLEYEGLIQDLLGEEDVTEQCDQLEDSVAAIQERSWQRYKKQGYSRLIDKEGLTNLVRLVSTQPAVAHLGFLRGLCRGPWADHFRTTEGRLQLDHGMPVAYAIRPIQKHICPATPYQLTLGVGSLLQDQPFELFRGHSSGAVRVTLDHSERHRVDELTWSASARLPRVATIHPTLNEGDLEIQTRGAKFFGVRPQPAIDAALLAELHKVRSSSEIAVLPELALSTPDALAKQLAAAPADYPALVVAGSAHVSKQAGSRKLHTNTSHVYLDGRKVLEHNKIQPFRDRRAGQTLTEGITQGAKDIYVLSGTHTRLAVLICADLNHRDIPQLLVNAGVNLLLVPALTPTDGAFAGPIGEIASHCQGVGVVVNARQDPIADKTGQPPIKPFMVLASVPRPAQSGGQAMPYRDKKPRKISCGLFNPNLPLNKAMSWR